MRLAKASLIAAALAAGSAGVTAQTGTADGAAALARGDYQQAARILQPLAERDPRGDPAAQFFMALLYEQGRGVPQDPLRSCALYHRAANFDQHPFGAQAMHLMRAAWQRHGNEFFQDCQLISSLGFDHRFEPVTFELAPGHSVAWTLKGATVSYQERTTRHEMRLAARGAAYLPLRYTALTGRGPKGRVRHFVEVFLWQGGQSDWRLTWHLFEVSGTELIRIADEEALATSPVRPEASAPDDVRQMVTVRMNARGQAEWAIVAGANARTEPIESEEERRETRALREAEEAATSRVDWKRKYDSLRLPSLRYGTSGGCGHVSVYAWADERAETISVRLDREALQLSTAPRTIDLAGHPGQIAINVQVYDQPLRYSPFCTDVGISPGPATEVWRAVAGTVTVELSPPGVRARQPHLYRATIRIDNAEFLGSSGRRHRQTQPIVLSAIVGSMGG